MSIPRNHHYVSRCLIDAFLDTKGRIYLYDKQSGHYRNANSSEKVFSEIDLNTFIDKEGDINYREVENSLNIYFEKDFPIHYKRMTELAAETSYNKLEEMAESGELAESVYYIMSMATIGESRTPSSKAEIDNMFIEICSQLSGNTTEGSKNKIKEKFAITNKESLKIPYRTPSVDFKKLSHDILKGMEDIIVTIGIAPKGDYFILPDCTSVKHRAQLIPHTILNGEKFIAPKTIASVGMPLNSQIFIQIKAKKISKEKLHTTKYLDSKTMFDINCDLYRTAYKSVACENRAYLTDFIQKQMNSI